MILFSRFLRNNGRYFSSPLTPLRSTRRLCGVSCWAPRVSEARPGALARINSGAASKRSREGEREIPSSRPERHARAPCQSWASRVLLPLPLAAALECARACVRVAPGGMGIMRAAEDVEGAVVAGAAGGGGGGGGGEVTAPLLLRQHKQGRGDEEKIQNDAGGDGGGRRGGGGGGSMSMLMLSTAVAVCGSFEFGTCVSAFPSFLSLWKGFQLKKAISNSNRN